MTNSTIPAAAFRLRAAGPLKLAPATADAAATTPVRMLARTGAPINHFWWGPVVHDLAGMVLRKDRLPIDYCHDCGEILGYLDSFEVEEGDLWVGGQLAHYRTGDRADEIRHKAALGVPYEASIDFHDELLRFEEVLPGAAVTVNGRDLAGPLIVVRQWVLRGVAICPYGADAETRTEVSAETLQQFRQRMEAAGAWSRTGGDPQTKEGNMGKQLAAALSARIDEIADENTPRAEVVEAMAEAAGIEAATVENILDGSIDCPPRERLEGFARALDVTAASLVEAAEADGCHYGEQAAKAGRKAADPPADPPAEGADPRAEVVGELRRFQSRFGAERGAAWFSEGLPYADAIERRLDQLSAENDQLRAKLDAAVAAAGEDPVSPGGDGDAHQAAAGKSLIRLK